jgi:DNA polymerase-3 subunit epsilon
VRVWLSLQRWRWRRLADPALRRFWDAPLPASNRDWRQTGFLVCDAEMSSLDPDQGELLSLGWVAVDSGAIALATARHVVIRAEESVGQSATVHRLRDCEVADGVEPAQAMDLLLEAARGRVLVFHNATLDLAYLDRLCRRLHGAPLLQPHLCTLQLEQRRLVRREQPIRQGELTLAGCRARYRLPAYQAHNALGDALATAELLLAHFSSGQAVTKLR